MELPKEVQEILERLEAAGYQGWCVGGCVRDAQLGRTPSDWDVTTDALPEETMRLFGSRAVPTGLQHGTVTVRTEHGGVEVTTFRRDGVYRDHRRPESVQFTPSLEEDLARRDFTVNAVAVNRGGIVCDPFGGQTDLQRGILRCVGDPKARFQEDALRMLRGLRFAAVLPFSLEETTAAAVHQCRELLRDIAPERIQTELTGLLLGNQAAEVLRAFPDVLGVFWSEILPLVGLDQRNCHHCYDAWEHTLHAVEQTPPEKTVRYAALLHDIGKPNVMTVDAQGVGHFYGHPAVSAELANEMLRRLRFDNQTRETVVQLVTWHDRQILPTERAVRRCLHALGAEQFRRLLLVKRADNLAQAPEYWGRQEALDELRQIAQKLLAADACFSRKQLAVSGRDLLALGLRGREIGQTLERLLEEVLEERLPNRQEELLSFVRQQRTNAD